MDSGYPGLWRIGSAQRLTDGVNSQIIVEGRCWHGSQEILLLRFQVFLQGRIVQVQPLIVWVIVLVVGVEVRLDRMVTVQVPSAENVAVPIVVVALSGTVRTEA